MVLHLHEHSKTEPRKKLSWLINNPPDEQIQEWTITPEIAKQMLGFNSNNRPISKATVKQYGEEMRAGNWRLTYEPIVFSNKARLIDGQHRLHACLWSGVAFPARVAFGDDDSNFDHINIGKKRTGADVFSIYGVPNAALSAGTTRILMGYFDRAVSGGSDPGAKATPVYKLYQRYIGFNRLQDSIKFGQLCTNNSKTLKGTSPSVIAAAHYICAQKHRSEADLFYRKTLAGVGIEKTNDPANRLRSAILANAQSGVGDPKMTMRQLLALCMLAWNAMRAGKTPATLKWNADEKFPRAQ